MGPGTSLTWPASSRAAVRRGHWPLSAHRLRHADQLDLVRATTRRHAPECATAWGCAGREFFTRRRQRSPAVGTAVSPADSAICARRIRADLGARRPRHLQLRRGTHRRQGARHLAAIARPDGSRPARPALEADRALQRTCPGNTGFRHLQARIFISAIPPGHPTGQNR